MSAAMSRPSTPPSGGAPALDEADRVEEAAVNPQGVVPEIVRLLTEAANLAASIGRGDWERKMNALIRHISGRATSPTQLRPLGPLVHLDAWVASVQEALVQFADDVSRASQDDPAGFPLDRTAADWWAEFGERAVRFDGSPTTGGRAG